MRARVGWALSFCALWACGEDSLFGGSGSASGGAGGSGGATDTTTTTTDGGGPASSSSSAGGGPASSSSAATTSTSSGPMPCEHAPCEQGNPLDPMCDDPCVVSICQMDPYCCDTAWDYICTGEVWQVCQQDCGMGPGCEDQYSEGTVGYYLCVQGNDCIFGFDSTMHSCATVCTSHGGECLGAYNNNGMCGLGQQVDCNFMMFASALCACSRGCGGGPACMNGQVCSNGQCL
jgi:hypothetical protein